MKFTNTRADGEVTGYNPDARRDIYDVGDHTNDMDYMQSKILQAFQKLSSDPDLDCYILYGGEVTDGGGGTVDIAEAAVMSKDESGETKLVIIPATAGITLPAGWNDNRQIWVTATWTYKLGSDTRQHKVTLESYHYNLEDSYLGEEDTDDFFVDSDPNAVADTICCLGSFQMSGGGVFTDLSSGERSPYIEFEYQGPLKIDDTTDSSSKDTGSIITEGGIGVEKTLVTGGKVLVKDTTDSSSKDTGSIITEGGIGVEKSVRAGTYVEVGVQLIINGTTQSTSKDTGSIITEGGIGVEKNAYIGGGLNVADTTDSGSKDSGSIVAEGGIGVEKSIYAGDNIVTEGGFLKGPKRLQPNGDLSYTTAQTQDQVYDGIVFYLTGIQAGQPHLASGGVLITGTIYPITHFTWITGGSARIVIYYVDSAGASASFSNYDGAGGANPYNFTISF